MKKILSILMLGFLFAFNAQAQGVTTIALAAGDTVVNTGTASKIIGITSGYAGIAIQAIVTKISGTNGGTIQIFGSNDGVNYTSQIGSTYTVTTASVQGPTFYITAPIPRYIKVLETGTGTMSSVLTVNYLPRKYQTQ